MWKVYRQRRWRGGSTAPKPQSGRILQMHVRSSGGISKEGSGSHMKHPNQAALALYAGGDLGLFARWRVQRHVPKCERCSEEVASFEAMRTLVTELAEIPDI